MAILGRWDRSAEFTFNFQLTPEPPILPVGQQWSLTTWVLFLRPVIVIIYNTHVKHNDLNYGFKKQKHWTLTYGVSNIFAANFFGILLFLTWLSRNIWDRGSFDLLKIVIFGRRSLNEQQQHRNCIHLNLCNPSGYLSENDIFEILRLPFVWENNNIYSTALFPTKRHEIALKVSVVTS